MTQPARTLRPLAPALLATLLLLGTACGPSDQARRRQQAQDAYDHAQAAAADGKIDAAIVGYTDVVRIAPGFTLAYNNRGVLYQQQGQLDKAIADYTTAIGQLPDRANLYFNRASAYQAQGHSAKAEADLARAKALTDPTVPPSE